MSSILIGDDSPVLRRTLRTFLEAQDHWKVVGEATNGKEAVERAQELKPDLVVLDVSMPVMNGLDATRELKRIMPSLPIIIFTTYNTNELTQEAIEAGASAVVAKSEFELLTEKIYLLLASVV